MKKKIKSFCAIISEYVRWIFFDASKNHIHITKTGKNRFFSYTSLKKYQKKVRRTAFSLFLITVSLVFGLVAGPAIFPEKMEPEVYIPNGKGDIIIGNISKNQATIIFKTLDGANENKPLATRAVVEVYKDKEFKEPVRTVRSDVYAVTHIVPVDNLQENNNYYVRIIASESSEKPHSKILNSWGDGSDLISFYTAGEIIPSCKDKNEIRNISENKDAEKVIVVNNDEVNNVISEAGSLREEVNREDSSLQIFDVQNENYLQPKNKIQTIISWRTNLPASTAIIYSEGSTGEKTEIEFNKEERTGHAAVLMTLKTATTYYFNVKSVAKDGQVVVSEQYSLRTPKAREDIYEKIISNFKGLFRIRTQN